MEHLVILDGYTLNPGDLDWSRLEQFGEVRIYDRTPVSKVIERSKAATILIINKVKLSADLLISLPQLKHICISATGYDNVDIAKARELGVTVSNVSGYSTPSVVQHVFALLLALVSKVKEHSESVFRGDWSRGSDFSYSLIPIHELKDKVLGILGFGTIGQQVGQIGNAFGMKVIAHHRHPERDAKPWVTFVGLDELFSTSDILTLHAPLNTSTKQIINSGHLKKMKTTAYLINTARGGLINEHDLAGALKEEIIAGAGLDVLSKEPPLPDNPLLKAPNCLITPHYAWASVQSRQRLMDELILNIEALMRGESRNLVTG